MKVYRINYSYRASGGLDIEANSPEEAKAKFDAINNPADAWQLDKAAAIESLESEEPVEVQRGTPKWIIDLTDPSIPPEQGGQYVKG
jgi:hypothetical protein